MIALVGRGVFFLSWSVVMAAFPLAARSGRRDLVFKAVLTVAGLSAMATAGVAIAMPHLTEVLFGAE